jgi:hypothetical protein
MVEPSSLSNTIINESQGNTNIVINAQSGSTTQFGSYQEGNRCIKPEHSLAVMLLDSNESGAGGILRDSYEFKVKSVRPR